MEVDLTADEQALLNRAVDLISLAAGPGNDLEAARRAVLALPPQEVRRMLGFVVGVGAAIADTFAGVNECDVHDLLAKFR